MKAITTLSFLAGHDFSHAFISSRPRIELPSFYSNSLSPRSPDSVFFASDNVDINTNDSPQQQSQEEREVKNEDSVNKSSLEQKERASNLKRQLYQLAASFDRGFGATPRAREEANAIIEQLTACNPTQNAANGIDGDGGFEDDDVPLKAIWRMVWTSALDVVSLAASPIAAPSAIYQVITDPPIATNVIDFIPRAQTFFPPSVAPPSLLRAEVTTRASSRSGMPERVGLTFEAVTLRPIEILGQKVDGNLPPLSVDLTWPRSLLEPFFPGMEVGNSENNADALGYFDVEYLDDELLVIRQQAPGGVFALVKVDNFDP